MKISDIDEDTWQKLYERGKAENLDIQIGETEEKKKRWGFSPPPPIPLDEKLKEMLAKIMKKMAKQQNKIKDVGEPKLISKSIAQRQIKEILSDNETRRAGSPSESGLLQHKKLWRYKTTPRIFNRKDRATRRDYALSLVIDCSGSMCNQDPCNQAPEMAAQLVKDFQEILPIEVIGFNQIMYQEKHFSEHMNNEQITKMYKNLGTWKQSRAYGSYGNHDHIAIKKAVKNLMKQGSKKKLLIVISDGAPCCGDIQCHNRKECRDKRMGDELQDTVRTIPKEILTFGIGINSNSVKNYYQKSAVLQNAEKLYPTLLPFLRSNIKKHQQ